MGTYPALKWGRTLIALSYASKERGYVPIYLTRMRRYSEGDMPTVWWNLRVKALWSE